MTSVSPFISAFPRSSSASSDSEPALPIARRPLKLHSGCNDGTPTQARTEPLARRGAAGARPRSPLARARATTT